MLGTAVDDRPSREVPSTRRFRSAPKDGDVLVSKRTARADLYTISIVPGAGNTRVRHHSEAIEKVQELSAQLGVDGWFTCNHTHFACVAMHRTERPGCGTSGQSVEVNMLQRGDSVPDFEVRTLEGEPFTYSTIWQRKNLLLVSLPTIDSEAASAYAADVTARVREFDDQDFECVVTLDQIPRIAPPAVVIADRWGEIVFAVEKSEVAHLPAPQELDRVADLRQQPMSRM